ncbi:RseC/MucC family positive regulator of sigma(E) [Bacteroides sp. 214]|uniref:SoxR reducing system RseC family protein n=1 Tax=Bacteroides sp. 214 TaxID=2302935 RepID=UPI0013D71318|nr:SoxR reducing system RseC family protein [Bacteroides sp. 214]NDW12793.1 RseC/MucC family positive regulator of sigma(E) [Bacteroides sp. 214]
MNNVISHQGIVESTEGNHIRVKIVQTAACASCSIKGHCTSADTKEKIVDIYTTTHVYQIGDVVEVIGETSMGMKAVLYAFVIPFLVLVISLFTVMSLTAQNELFSAGISLLLLIIYYVILSLNKNKFKKSFLFKIKPL